MSIRLLIADDHEMVRRGLMVVLSTADIEIVGQATNGFEAIQLTESLHPDVLLLDVRMPELDGLDALDQLAGKSPTTRVVIFSAYDNPTYVARAATLGAVDYVLKDAPRCELLDAIRAAAAGDMLRRSQMLRRVTSILRSTSMPLNGDTSLTVREMQVLRHLGLGLSNKEIGRSLSISVETVKEHVQNILRKIKVVDRTQAAVWALHKGVVQ